MADGHTDGQMYIETEVQTEAYIDIRTDGQTHRLADAQMDKRIDIPSLMTNNVRLNV